MKNIITFLLLIILTSTGLTLLHNSQARAQAITDAATLDAATTPPAPVATVAPTPDAAGSAVLVVPVSPGNTTSTVTTTLTTSTLHDPMLDPTGAFDDIRAAKKVNWPLALLAGLLIILKGMGSASKRWPKAKPLVWLNTGKAAFILAGFLTVGAATFNSLALGGTWFAVMSACAASLFSLMVPTPLDNKV